jgi:hypothetical protein
MPIHAHFINSLWSTRMAHALSFYEVYKLGGIHIYGHSQNMKDIQIYDLHISHIQPTLLG